MAAAAPVPPRLEVQHLIRQFGDKPAVRDVSFAIEAGQVMCLLGPSGCGKSTTLRIIAGVEKQDSGRILVDGDLVCDTIYRLPPEKRAVGLMFQDFALFPHLTVTGNVAYGLRGTRAEKQERVADLLSRVGLHGYGEKYPHQLSGGEQQRVALARAIAPQPKVMLMDEPFSGLDERLRDAVRDETLQLLVDEGTAVLMVTHDPVEAMRMGDVIALMRSGRIVQQGSPYTIYNTPADLQAARFFSDINVIEAEVNGALAQTPFGPFLAPGVTDGSKVDIAIRPQHVHIDFDRPGQAPRPTDAEGQAAHASVLRARFLGQQSLVDFRLDDGPELTASVPGVFLPKAGTGFYLTCPRRHCKIFTR